MVKRLLSASPSEIKKMSASDLKDSIKASEGRIVLVETVVTSAPLIDGVTNAEVMAAFSCDMILLNEYDVFTKYINGMDEADPINKLKEWAGRPIGINLEPVDETIEKTDLISLSSGRLANEETFKMAEEQGVDFILLTGNPATGVTNKSIEDAISVAKNAFTGLVFAGKMHGAGVSEKIISKEQMLRFLDKGADGVLVPAVGTIPGVYEEELREIVESVHDNSGLVISAVGTSQESADVDTIRQFGLSNKRVGADIHHLGDGGFGRMPDPENIMALSTAIRGRRHTYNRMSISLNK